MIPAVLACLVAAAILAAVEWGRFCACSYLSVLRWLSSLDHRAAKPRDAQWLSRSPLLGDRSTPAVEPSRGPAASRPDSRPSSLESPHSSPPPARRTADPESAGSEPFRDPPHVDFARRDYHVAALAALPLGAALQPDFDAFFGGLEAAVAAGGVLLIACVVVLAIRRFVSF